MGSGQRKKTLVGVGEGPSGIPSRGDSSSAEDHQEILIRLAAGYQHREAGITDHLRRIAEYTALLASLMKLKSGETQLLKKTSVFHDVGMVDVPDPILNSSVALTKEEQELVHRHTLLGYFLLRDSGTDLLDQAAALALHHHEHFDGNGYPNRLSGDQIPLQARILAVADVFDALTTPRPYKEAYPFIVGFEIVKALSESHFDPAVVSAMESGIETFERIYTEHHPGLPVTPSGFRISSRDESVTGLFSAARNAYFSCPYCGDLHPHSMILCPSQGHELREIHKLSGRLMSDKYRLGRALGVGGMGTVYKAENILIERDCAIKFLDPSLSRDEKALARFQSEARIAAMVKHSNLVEVLDMGKTNEGLPFIVMELLEGRNLARIIQDLGQLSPILAVTIGLQILEALRAIHDAGIVHRDLKPENVFLAFEHDGLRVKLLDFGISRVSWKSSGKHRLTQAGVLIGTPQYMSPEQASGLTEIDERTDLFTMGAILYEMLTGRAAFDSDDLDQVLHRVREASFPSPRHLLPEIPDVLNETLIKALQKEARHRFQRAVDFTSPLRAYLSFVGSDDRLDEQRRAELFPDGYVEE